MLKILRLFKGRLMRTKGLALMMLACTLFAGCANDLSCDDIQRYQKAREGTRIDAPDDLDELEASKELTVPSASPRDARAKGSPCLDLPPVLQSKGT